jgi:hypothetical protein
MSMVTREETGVLWGEPSKRSVIMPRKGAIPVPVAMKR